MRNVLKEPFSQILNMHKLLSGDSVQQFAKLGTWPRKYRRMCFEIEEIHSQSLIYSKSQNSQVFCKWAANWVVNPDLNEQKTKLLFCQSLTQLRPTLYDPMDSSMPGFPVLHCPLCSRVCSNSCPLSQWCCLTISSCKGWLWSIIVVYFDGTLASRFSQWKPLQVGCSVLLTCSPHFLSISFLLARKIFQACYRC